MGGGGMAGEEPIVVSVRLWPVNARKTKHGDSSEWEYAGPTTLMFCGTVPERAMFPTTYTYGTSRTCMTCLAACTRVPHASISHVADAHFFM